MRKFLTGFMLLWVMLCLWFGIGITAFAADDMGVYVQDGSREVAVTDGSYVKGYMYAKIKGYAADFTSIGVRCYKSSGSAPSFVNINLNNQSNGYIEKSLFDFRPGDDKYTVEIQASYKNGTVKSYKSSFIYSGKEPEVSIRPSGIIKNDDNAILYIGTNTIPKSINYIDVKHDLIESSLPTSNVVKSYNSGNAKRFYPELLNMSEPLEDEGYHRFIVDVKYSVTQTLRFTHIITVDKTAPTINVSNDELEKFRKNDAVFKFNIVENGVCNSGIRENNSFYSLRNADGSIAKWEAPVLTSSPQYDSINKCFLKMTLQTKAITVSGDGIKTMAVYTVDKAGSVVIQDFQIKFDTTKPNITKGELYNASDDTLVEIKNDDGSYLSLSDKIKLRVTGEDNLAGMGKLYLFRRDADSAAPAPTQAQIIQLVRSSDPNAGVVEFLGSDTADLDISALSKGKYYDVFYFVSDYADNYSDMQKMSVVFDTDAPETPLITSLSHPEAASKGSGAQVPKSDVAGNKQQFEFKVTIPDSQNMNSVSSIDYSIYKYSLNSGVSDELLDSGRIAAVRSGSSYLRAYTKTSDVTFEDNEKDEFYRIQVQTRSKNGLLSSPANFYFRVDTRAPYMQWNGTDLEKWISSGNSGVGWTLYENTGNPDYKYFISSTELSEDDIKAKEGEFDTLNSFNPLTVRGQFYLPAAITLPAGTNYLYLFAKDNAGNIGSLGRVVNVDSEEPVFNGTEDLMITLHPENNSVDLSWDVIDTVSGIELINYRIAPKEEWKTEGNVWKYIDNLYPAPMTHVSTYTVSGLDPSKEYKVQLEVRDMAGNSAYTSVVSFTMSGITGRQKVIKISKNIMGVQISGRYDESTEEPILSTFKIDSLPSDLSLAGNIEIENVSLVMLGGVVQSLKMDINVYSGVKIGEFTFNCGDTSKMVIDYDISSNPNGSIKFQNVSLVLPFGSQEEGLSLQEVAVGLSPTGKIYPIFQSTETVAVNFPYEAGGITFEGLSCNDAGLKAGRTTISIGGKDYIIETGVSISSEGTLKPAAGNVFFETDNFMDFSLGDATFFSVNGIRINEESIELNIDTSLFDALAIRGVLEYRFSSGQLYDYCVYLDTINGAQFYAGLKEVSELSFEQLVVSKDAFDVNGGSFKMGQKFPLKKMANNQYNFDGSFSKEFFDVIDAIKKFKVYSANRSKGIDVSNMTLFCGIKFTAGTIMNFEKVDGRMLFEFSGGVVLPASLGSRTAENIKLSIDDDGNISFYAYDIDLTGIGIGSFKLEAQNPQIAGGKALASIAYVDGKISMQLYNAVLNVILEGKSIKCKLEDISLNQNGDIESFNLSATNVSIKVSNMLNIDIGSMTFAYDNGGFSISCSNITANITGLGKYTVNNLSFDDKGNINDFSITVPFSSSFTKSDDYEFNGNLTISYVKAGKLIKATIAGNNGAPATFTLKTARVSRLKPLEGLTFNINVFEMVNGKIVKCDMALPNSKQINLFGDTVTASINSLSFNNSSGSVELGFRGYVKVKADNKSITVNLKLDYYPEQSKISIDASYSGDLEFKIGGFKLIVSKLAITTEKVEFEEARLELPEGLGSLSVNKCFISYDGQIQLGGVTLKINRDIVYDVAGCELTLRDPSLAITTLDEIVLRFKNVKLEVFGSASIEAGGLTLFSNGDFAFDNAKIGLPSFSIGGLGLRDLFVSFGKDIDGGKSYRYFGGGGSVAIPGLGEVGCTLIVQKRPGNFFGDNIKEASFKLELDHGIPLGNTGLELNYLAGGLYRGTMPEEFPKQYKDMFAGDWKMMSLGIGVQDLSGGNLLEAQAHIFIELNDFEWAFKGNGSVLSGVINGEVRAAYANKIFAAGATVNMTFAEGKVDFYVFQHKGKTQVSGEGKCTIRVKKGSWYGGKKVWGVQVLPAIPPWDVSVVSVGVDFGLFKNGKKGVQGWIDLKLLGSISAFVGTSGLVLDSDYKIYNPIKENASAARIGGINATAMLGSIAMADTAIGTGSLLLAEEPNKNYLFETQTDSAGRTVSVYKFNAEGERILFGMTFDQVLPDMQIIAPDGSILEFGNDDVEYYVGNNELIMAVTNLDTYGTGQWQIRASGISKEEVLIACKNYVPEINVENISIDTTANKAAVKGTVTNMKDGSILKLIFQTKEGSLEREVDVPLTGSSFDSVVNIPSLPDGQYVVFVRLEWEGANGNPVYLSTDPYTGILIEVNNKSKAMQHVKELSALPYAYYRYDPDKNAYEVDESGNKIKGYGVAVQFEDDNDALNDGYMLHIEHLGDAGEVISKEKQNLGALKSINLKGFKKRFVYKTRLDAEGNPVLDDGGNPVIDVTQVPDKLKVYVKPYRINKAAADENQRYQEIDSTADMLIKYPVIGEDVPLTNVSSVQIQNLPSEIVLEVGGTFPKAESDPIKLTAYANGDMVRAEVIGVPKVSIIKDGKSTIVPVLTAILDKSSAKVSSGEAVFELRLVAGENALKMSSEEINKVHDIKIRLSDGANVEGFKEVTLKVRLTLPALSINSVLPLSINSMTGGDIDINGTGFVEGTKVYLVSQNGTSTELTDMNIPSQEFIRCKVPAGLAAGNFIIKVTRTNGEVTFSEPLEIVKPMVGIVDYKLSGHANPSATASFYFGIKSVNGFSTKASFAFGTLPQGLSLSLDKTSYEMNALAKITATLTSQVPLGVHQVKILWKGIEVGVLKITVTNETIKPYISYISPNPVGIGDSATVYGEGLSGSPAASILTSRDKTNVILTVTSFGSSMLKVAIPSNASTGALSIKNNGVESNAKTLNIISKALRIVPKKNSIILYPGEIAYMTFEVKGGGAGVELTSQSESINVDTSVITGTENKLKIEVSPDAPRRTVIVNLTASEAGFTATEEIKVCIADPAQSTEEYTRGVETSGRSVSLWFKPNNITVQGSVSLMYSIRGGTETTVPMVQNNGRWEYKIGMLANESIISYRFKYTVSSTVTTTDKYEYRVSYKDADDDSTIFELDLTDNGGIGPVSLSMIPKSGFAPAVVKANVKIGTTTKTVDMINTSGRWTAALGTLAEGTEMKVKILYGTGIDTIESNEHTLTYKIPVLDMMFVTSMERNSSGNVIMKISTPIKSEDKTFSVQSLKVKVFIEGEESEKTAAAVTGGYTIDLGPLASMSEVYYQLKLVENSKLYMSEWKKEVFRDAAYIDYSFGVIAEYFKNKELSDIKMTRIDQNIDYNYGSGTPSEDIGEDTFSIRWKGLIQPKYSEEYTFYLTVDDGARLYIDDKLIIDSWTNKAAAQTVSGKAILKTGQMHKICVEYFENIGNASVKLEWSSTKQIRQVVPSERLFAKESDDYKNAMLFARYNYEIGDIITPLIIPNIEISNIGPEKVDLSNVTLRYWYTNESGTPQSAEVYYASCDKANVNARFVKLDENNANSEQYLEISFKPNAGFIDPDGVLKLKLGLHCDNWANYHQGDDYTFDEAAQMMITNSRMTIYSKEKLIWGTEPEILDDIGLPEVLPQMKVQYFAESAQQYSQQISPALKLVNSSNKGVNLSNVKIRYYFTNESANSQSVALYWADCGNANVNTSIINTSANSCYYEVSFKESAGTLAPMSSLTIKSAITSQNYGTYNQSDDYSFNASNNGNYTDNGKITCYYKDQLIWGQEP